VKVPYEVVVQASNGAYASDGTVWQTRFVNQVLRDPDEPQAPLQGAG